VQMLFDFRTCAAQWLAHARGSGRASRADSEQPPPHSPAGAVCQLLPPPR
jgi:hypothetical protein